MTNLPHAKRWQRSLERRLDARAARRIVLRARERYVLLWWEHAAQQDGRKRALLKKQLLPGLAIYRALIEETGNHEDALGVAEAIFGEVFFARTLPGIRLLNLLPDPFPVLRPALRMMSANVYGPGSQEIIEDTPDCLALNVYRCFIFVTLSAYGAAELTRAFCQTDDWLAGALDSISWERTQTLGRGGDCCDFRWCRAAHREAENRI